MQQPLASLVTEAKADGINQINPSPPPKPEPRSPGGFLPLPESEKMYHECRTQQKHYSTREALPFFISKLHLAHKKPANVINSPLQDMVLINYWVIQGDSCVKRNLYLLMRSSRDPS